MWDGQLASPAVGDRMTRGEIGQSIDQAASIRIDPMAQRREKARILMSGK
jgi:hypothetical protein